MSYLAFAALLNAHPDIPAADVHRRFPAVTSAEMSAWYERYRLDHPATRNQLDLLARAVEAGGQVAIPDGFPRHELAQMMRLQWIGGVTPGGGRCGAGFVNSVVAAAVSGDGLGRQVLARHSFQLALFDFAGGA